MIFRLLLYLATVCCFILPQTVYADHNPPNEVSQRPSERQLAKIFIMKSTLQDVVKIYGEPTDESNDGYIWEKEGWTLNCLIDTPENKVISIEVQGQRMPKSVGVTGSGLKVGDAISSVRRIYGTTFHLGDSFVAFEWRDGVTLDIDFDKAGKINRFFLSAVEAAE
jgi:hypothetical protein